jgi:phage shock protein C
MQENTESQEKKETKKVLFEVPGVAKESLTGESGTKPEKNMKQKETGGEFKTESASLERKEPKESDFKSSGAETGYTQESWAKPEESMEIKEESEDLSLERKEPSEGDFKASGEIETGYTQKSWEKPEKDMGKRENSGEFRTETKEEKGEKKREETREEKSTIYTMQKRLTKSKTERKIFGVCGGLAEYFGIDPTLVRLAFVILALFNGIGLVIYIILAVIMPSEESVEMMSVTSSSNVRK